MRRDVDERFEGRRPRGRPYTRHTVDLRQRGFISWWRRTPPGKLFLISFAISFLLPFCVLVFGLIGAYIWSGGR